MNKHQDIYTEKKVISTIPQYNTVVIGAGVLSYNVPVENVLKVKQICLG
jgi:hypothetical protein